MNTIMVAMLVLVGLVTGILAGYVLRRGGYGMRWDIFLGLIGSVAGTWIFSALGFSPGSGLIALTVVAFTGAAVLIGGQRLLRPRPWIWSFLRR